MSRKLLLMALWDITRWVLTIVSFVGACAFAIWMGVRNPYVALGIILSVIFVFGVGVRYAVLHERAHPKYPGGI